VRRDTFDGVEVEKDLSDDDAGVKQNDNTQQYLYRIALQKLDDLLTSAAAAVSSSHINTIPHQRQLRQHRRHHHVQLERQKGWQKGRERETDRQQTDRQTDRDREMGEIEKTNKRRRRRRKRRIYIASCRRISKKSSM